MEEKKHNTPFPLTMQFFRWVCRAEFQEDIEGDLLEKFQFDTHRKGIRYAQWLLIKEVILLIRPNLISTKSLTRNLQFMTNHQILRLSLTVILAVSSLAYLRNSHSGEESIPMAGDSIPHLSYGTPLLFPSEEAIAHEVITNKDWSEFMHVLQSDSTYSFPHARVLLSTHWEQKNSSEPVSGISWLQAQEFCQWKSAVATYITHNEIAPIWHNILITNKLRNKHINYRLPTTSEWNTISRGYTLTPNAELIAVIEEKYL